MQDKEFDEMFKNLFEGAAIEPSERMWAEIAGKLDTPAKKKVSPRLWTSIAAAAAGLLICGFLFAPKEKVYLRGNAATGLADTAPLMDSKPALSLAQHEELPERKSVPLVIAPRLSKEETAGFSSKVQEDTLRHIRPGAPEVAKWEQSIDRQPIIANVQVQKKEEAMILASTELEGENTEGMSGQQQERRAIRNVGDLVNFVVGKVDKRENKIVEFDTDDDNSSLVSLNLGIVRFNRKAK